MKLSLKCDFFFNFQTFEKIRMSYLYFSAFYNGCVKLFSGSVSIWTVGKRYKTEAFGSSLVKNDFHIQDGAKFL